MNKLKTRITAILDAHGITYSVLPHSEPAFTVKAAAQQRGVPVGEMVKAILLRDRDGRYVLACVTGDARLDPKAVRDHLPGNWKRLYLASAAEIQELTGSPRGAIAPLGLPEGVPVIFDAAIARCAKVNISSGDPMAGLELDSGDLLEISGARLGQIAKPGDAAADSYAKSTS